MRPSGVLGSAKICRRDASGATTRGVLPGETWVYPGHGKDNTLGAERPHLVEHRDADVQVPLPQLAREFSPHLHEVVSEPAPAGGVTPPVLDGLVPVQSGGVVATRAPRTPPPTSSPPPDAPPARTQLRALRPSPAGSHPDARARPTLSVAVQPLGELPQPLALDPPLPAPPSLGVGSSPDRIRRRSAPGRSPAARPARPPGRTVALARRGHARRLPPPAQAVLLDLPWRSRDGRREGSPLIPGSVAVAPTRRRGGASGPAWRAVHAGADCLTDDTPTAPHFSLSPGGAGRCGASAAKVALSSVVQPGAVDP